MSRRNKLIKFEAVQQAPFAFECFSFENPQLYRFLSETVSFNGIWSSSFFNNNNPIVLELACGNGEYSVSLAEHFPEKNFIGIDIKGARIFNGIQQVAKKSLKNVAFIRSRIELITHFFSPQEIDEIWITFPDPFLKESKSNKRLTSPFFLEKYLSLLKPGGIIHLKTDDETLYEFSKTTFVSDNRFNVLEEVSDIYSGEIHNAALTEIQTKYEKKHLSEGKSIKYILAKKIAD